MFVCQSMEDCKLGQKWVLIQTFICTTHRSCFQSKLFHQVLGDHV